MSLSTDRPVNITTKDIEILDSLNDYPVQSEQIENLSEEAAEFMLQSHSQNMFPALGWNKIDRGSISVTQWIAGGPYPYGLDKIFNIYSDIGMFSFPVEDARPYKDKRDGLRIYKDRADRLADWLAYDNDNDRIEYVDIAKHIIKTDHSNVEEYVWKDEIPANIIKTFEELKTEDMRERSEISSDFIDDLEDAYNSEHERIYGEEKKKFSCSDIPKDRKMTLGEQAVCGWYTDEPMKSQEEFKEDEHPRDEGGQFSEKEGGGDSGNTYTQDKKVNLLETTKKLKKNLFDIITKINDSNKLDLNRDEISLLHEEANSIRRVLNERNQTKRDEKENQKLGKMVNGKLQIKEKIPEFSSIKDVKKWVSDMGEKYGGKNRFSTSNVYSEAYPKIVAVYDRENHKEAKQRQDVMKEKGHKVGDVVEYTYVGNSLWQEPYTVQGTIKMDKDGFPYVRGTDKKRYNWHKRFRKMSGESVIVKEGNEYYNVSREEFKEEDHPRGQPDNSGQFVSGSGNKKKAERIRYDRKITSGFTQTKKRALQSLSMLNRYKDVSVHRYGETDEEYEKLVELAKQTKNYERDIEVLKNITSNPTSEQLKEIDNTAKSMLLDNELDEKFPDVSYKFTHYPNRKFTIAVSGFSGKYPYDLYTVAKKYENNEMSGPDGHVNRKGVIVDIDYNGASGAMRVRDHKLFPNREIRLANWMDADISKEIDSTHNHRTETYDDKREKFNEMRGIVNSYINDGVIDEKYSDIMKNTIKEFEEQEKKENAETIIVKEGNEYYEVKLYSHEEFKEEDHPRGQPENSGQFVSGGGSKSNEPNSEPEKDYKWNGINFAHMVPRQLGDAYNAIQDDPAKKEELKRLWNEKVKRGEVSPDMMDKYSFLSDISKEKEKEIKKEVERKLKPPVVEKKNRLGFLVQKGVEVNVSERIHKDQLEKIAKTWNKIPPEHRRNVKFLTLKYGNEGGGSYKFGSDSVSINVGDSWGDNYDIGVIYHEIGHSNHAHWPLKIIKEWNSRIKLIDPLTDYSRSWNGSKRTQTNTKRIRKDIIKVLNGPDKLKAKQRLRNVFKSWGIKNADIKSGKLKQMSDVFHERKMNMYQNEQHSEFMSIYYGNDTDKLINKTAYEQIKIIYEELQLKSYETHESYAGESYKKYVEQKMNVLKRKANENEEVGYLFSPKLHRHGKKIHGTLAYAGISLNNRLYLPEALSKGHNLRLRLLLNHSSTAGAEEELHRLEPEMRKALENGEDYEVGWVELEWKAEELTLYYKGEIEHPFFQKEVDEMDMSVSLGLVFDSNSPQVCDEQCYTVIMGAEWREVSLVYHPGFPIATIEAMENKMRSNENFFLSNEFDEDKHPRGQPDNAGQFVKNGGSNDQPESKKDPFEIKSGANYKNWRNVGTGDKYNEHSFKTEKYALDIILRQEHPKDDLMGVIASTHNDELYKFDDQKALESIWNGYAMENYENAKVLYRSMSTNELDSMLENDIMFSKSESRDYIPTTTDFDVAYDIPYSSEIIVLEFDKNQLDKYLVHPRYERGAFEKPEIDSPKESFYLYESEHRLLNKTVNHKELDFTIKAYNVYDKEKFKSKYSGLGKIEFLEKSEEAFKEEDHPRGQPENSGQFSKKNGSKSSSKKPKVNKLGSGRYTEAFLKKRGLTTSNIPEKVTVPAFAITSDGKFLHSENQKGELLTHDDLAGTLHMGSITDQGLIRVMQNKESIQVDFRSITNDQANAIKMLIENANVSDRDFVGEKKPSYFGDNYQIFGTVRELNIIMNKKKSKETIIVRKGNEYHEVGMEEFKEEDHPRDSDGQFASKYSWNGKNYSDLSPNEIASIYQLVDDPDRKKDLKKEWDKIIQNKNVEDLMRKSHPHMFEQSIFNDASPQKIADLYKETDDPNVKRMLKDEWDSRVEKDDIFKHDRQEWSHMNFTQQKDPDIDDTLDRNPWKGKDKEEQEKADKMWKNMSRAERQENLGEVSEKPTPDISDSDWRNFSSDTREYIHRRVGEMSEAEKSKLVNEVKEKINPRVREYMNKRTGWKVQKGVEVDTKQIRNKAFTNAYRDVWNKIPGSRKRNIKKITFLRAHNTRKNTDPGGRYNFKKDEIEFYYHGDSHNWGGNYAGIMEHEIGHSNLTVSWPVEAQREWIEGSKKIDPITSYVGEYKDDYKTEDGSPNRSTEIKTWTREFLDEATRITYSEAYDHDYILSVAKDKTRSLRKRWGTTAEDVKSGKFLKVARDYVHLMNNRYSDEQHADFVASYYGSNYKEYNKEAFEKLKTLRERIMLKYKITEAFVGESRPRESIIIKENGRYYEMGTEDFKEHEHPRDGDGKFSKKNEKLVKLLNIQHESNDLYRSHVKKYDKILGDHIKKMKDIRSTSSNEEIDKMEKIKNDKLDDITKEYRLRRRHLNSVMHEMEERFKTDSEFRSELRTVASDNDKNASSYTHMSSMFQEYIDFDKESDEFLTDRLNVVESVFRGINEKEYADLIQQKYFGEKSSPVGFVRVSTNKTVVMEKFMKFAMIEFSKKNINIINQGYTNEYDNDSTSEEGINGKQGYAFFFEEEFRIESNMKIPRSELKIHFYDIPKNKQSEILNECGHLGDVIFNSKKKSNETVIVKSGNEYYEMSTEDFKEHEHPRGGNPKNPGEFSENPGDGNDGDDDDKNDSEDKNVDHKFIDTIKNKMRKNISKALSPDFLKEANGKYVVLNDEFMDTFFTLKNQHPELWDEFKKSQFPLETRDYEKSDKIFESIMSKIRAPVLRQNKAITVAYNDIMDEKMADPSTIAKRFTKLNEVYDILKTGMLRENDDTKILSLQAEGGYDTYKSFTVADNHKYSGYGVEIRVPVKDMDFKVLKATPFARLSKSVKDGQYIRPHDLEQAEIRIKTTDGAKLPDNAEIMIDSHWIDNLEDKKRAAEIHRLIKESKFKIVDKDGNAYK